MFEILSFVFGVIVGFVIGFLVYRNNVKRFKKNEENLKDLAKRLQEEAKGRKEK